MTSIYKIAKELNISPATVSRALNDSGYVREELKAKILAVAKRTNYVPNMAARSLKLRQTWTIALVMPDISNPFFATIARGLEDRIEENDYTLIICNTDNSQRKENKYIRMLEERRVDGLIFIPARATSMEVSEVIKQSMIPVVVIDRDVGDMNLDRIVVDNVAGAEIAITHLLERGHREIAFISGPNTTRPGRDRLQGYINCLTKANIAVDDKLINYGDFTEKTGYAAMQELFACKVSFSAVFAANDLMAIGAMRAIRERNLIVPKDIAVVGYDGISVTDMLMPRLTTVVQPIYEMGRQAGERILFRAKHKDAPVERVTLLPTLRIREST